MTNTEHQSKTASAPETRIKSKKCYETHKRCVDHCLYETAAQSQNRRITEVPQDQYTDLAGRKWIQVWRTTMPGIQQLVWTLDLEAAQ